MRGRALFGLAAVVACAATPSVSRAAVLLLSPSAGSYYVGSTFDMDVLVDTEGESVNTMAFTISFPPDKLQVVSPSAGRSVVTVWTAPPRVDNAAGTIELQGGTPGGFTASRGLLTTLTFRVKSIGMALVRFRDPARVLLHDGRGTDVLKDTSNASLQLSLPPPAGPLVTSETHPNQTEWYRSRTVSFSWEHDPDVESYSYSLNDQPTDVPDDISEGSKTGVTYRDIEDGIHYFHVRAFRNGQWGGTTNFAVRVDGSPPADFVVSVEPSDRTSNHEPVVRFLTTDEFSGVNHYELKIVALSREQAAEAASMSARSAPLFVEVQSPYVPPPLEYGTYDVIVRAYDHAGNVRESTRRLSVVKPIFQVTGPRGVTFNGVFIVPWVWVWAILGVVLLVLALLGWWVRRAHRTIEVKKLERELPTTLRRQLSELEKYRAKYGKLAVILIMMSFSGVSMLGAQVEAAEGFSVDPPIISTVMRYPTNRDIFYAGGVVNAANAEVVVYLQNLDTGETRTTSVSPNERGEWFFQSPAFLVSGQYTLWAQTRTGELASPPSAQVSFMVERAALQIGSSRLSYETILWTILTLFMLVVGLLAAYIVFHAAAARKKYQVFVREIADIERSIRDGFAKLREDLARELEVVRHARMTRELSQEEAVREAQLSSDLAQVERHLGESVHGLGGKNMLDAH